MAPISSVFYLEPKAVVMKLKYDWMDKVYSPDSGGVEEVFKASYVM